LIGQHGDDQAEEGAGGRHDGSQRMLLKIDWRNSRSPNPLIIGRPTKLIAGAIDRRTGCQRRDHRIDQIDGQREQRRTEEQPWPDGRTAAQVARGGGPVAIAHRKELVEKLVRAEEIGDAANPGDHRPERRNQLLHGNFLPM
jgi:hypothetical protein